MPRPSASVAHDRLKALSVKVKHPAHRQLVGLGGNNISPLLLKDELKQSQRDLFWSRTTNVRHNLPRHFLVIGGEYSNQTNVLIKTRTSLSSGNAAVNVVCRGEHKSLIRNAMRAIGEFNERHGTIPYGAILYLNSGSRPHQIAEAAAA